MFPDNLDPELKKLLAAALIARGEKNFDEMIRVSDLIIETAPDSFIGYEMKADAFIFKGQDKEALGWLDSAIAHDKDRTINFLKRAAIYNALQKHDLALQDYSYVIERKEHLPQAYDGRASAHYFKNQWQQSIDDLERAASLGWTDLKFNYYMGTAYRFMHEDVKAVYYLDKAVADDPDDEDAVFARGRSHFDLKHWKQCERDMSHVLYLNDNQHIAYFFRGASKLFQKNIEGAKADLLKLYKIDPELVKRTQGKNYMPKEVFEALIKRK